ncbi:MAG: exodeoxyribonuclease VII small subunit [Phycisphaerae bacterium]|nr:exodeoxyribonuclease VII small subunit [Phycisphaerae bacterium]
MAKRKTRASGSEATISKLDFEQAIERLEGIVGQIESGEVGLEQSLDNYEEGMKMIRHCRKILGRAETRIRKLALDDEGNAVASGELEAE